MQRTFCNRISLLLATATTAAFMLNGCSGSDGTNGINGTSSPAATTGTVNASAFTNDNLNNVIPTGRILKASIPGKNPVVEIQVVDSVSGAGISGLKTFGLHIARLVPEADGKSSYWVNYIDKGISQPAPLAFAVANGKAVTGAITKPAADPGTTLVPANQNGLDPVKYPVGSVLLPGYTVVEKGDGVYSITFGSDITSNPNAPYVPTAIHRIGVTVTSIATPGVTATGPLTAAGTVNTSFLARNRLAVVQDFTPSSGVVLTVPPRDIVTTEACNQCHDSLATAGGHFARWNTQLCVMCHTATNTSGEGEFVTLIHRIHMGEKLPVMPLSEAVLNPTKPLPRALLMKYREQTYPQDIRNCTMCHKGVDGANWQSRPNRTNCGSCHNGINFATGAGTTNSGLPTGHAAGAQTNDSGCVLCHGTARVIEYHLAVIPPDPDAIENGGTNTRTNAGFLPAAGAVIPGAAVMTWEIGSVSVDATLHPVIRFKFRKNGTDVVFTTFAAGSVTEMMAGFAGSPSAYFAFAVPQDGIARPADFNATANVYIKNVWNGTVATSTLTPTPDAGGYYTLTINNVIVPAAASMLTGGIGYSYGNSTRPLTQIDLGAFPFNAATNVGGLLTVVPNSWKVATGYTGRRAIVSNEKCNNCHAKLGIAPTYHAGQRNDAPTCTFCHSVNRVNSGWAVNAKDIIHGIHAAGKRTNKFSWEVSAGAKFWGVTYPGYLRNCEQCHITGTYDFSASASSAAVPNLLWSTVATGTTPATISSIILGTETVPGTYYSPFVAANTAYGAGFSFAGATGTTTEAAGTTLVISPITAACFSCHDTGIARAHMLQNGASIYEARTTAFARTETCLVCHGTATGTSNSSVPSIKAVHRWW